MTTAKPRQRRRRVVENRVENARIQHIDGLTAYENFKHDFYPKLRKLLKDGVKAPDILKLAESVAAARLVMEATGNTDAKIAMAAAKDILDRVQGKAVEKREVTHQFSQLSDDELDSLLASKLAETEVVTDLPVAPSGAAPNKTEH